MPGPRFSDYIRNAKRLEQAIEKNRAARDKLSAGRGSILCQIMPARREAALEKETNAMRARAQALRSLRLEYFAEPSVVRNFDVDALPIQAVSTSSDAMRLLRDMG
ncbi:MAG: hypothetical protein KGJ78_08015 [Alphaproteobacteria bacterium]|nr:hypothetical protein [Alphaproteobacteria bacterium]